MEISRIVENLYHGTHPEGPDYRVLHDLGVGLVINMQGRAAPSLHPDPGPIPNLWLRTHDNPITRIPVDILAEGAMAAREVLDRGGRVFVHCRQGKHRSTAMVAAILITLGHSAKEAVRLIKTGRPRANPNQWYIRERIDLFEATWTHPRTERSHALVKLGQQRLERGTLSSAMRAFRKAIVADARNPEAWESKARVLGAAGKKVEAARIAQEAEWLRTSELATPPPATPPDETILPEEMDEVDEDDDAATMAAVLDTVETKDVTPAS